MTAPRRSVSIWSMSEEDRRYEIRKKAAAGARRALGKRDFIAIEPTPPPQYPAPIATIPPGGRQWKRIVFEVAIEHGVPVVLILGKQRNTPIKLARHHAIYRIATETKMSLMEIGRCMNRDHTTIIAAIAAHKRRQGISSVSPLSTVFTGGGEAPLTLVPNGQDASC